MIVEMNQSARFRTGSRTCRSRTPRATRRWARRDLRISGGT